MQPKPTEPTQEDRSVFSITAYIDLLGFANHFILASSDLRTEIGKYGSTRLGVLEDAIELTEKEREKYPELYPDTLTYIRINDAIFLGIDVKSFILPPVGEPNRIEGLSIADLEKLSAEKPTKDLPEVFQQTFGAEGIRVGKFIGLIARLHNYINEKEQEHKMPGCRTVICSGLRYRTYDRKGKEDFYSANFSFSNAYQAGQLGTKAGIKGNKLYLENSVAEICGYEPYTHKLLSQSKFIRAERKIDPYHAFQGAIVYRDFVLSTPFDIELFGKKYIFRELNPRVLSNFQILNEYLESARTKAKLDKDHFLTSILKSLETDTPSLEEVNNDSLPLDRYPFLFLAFGLAENFEELRKSLREQKQSDNEKA